MAHILLKDVDLTFCVRIGGRITLKEHLVGWLSGKRRKTTMEVRALRGINLEVREGDRLGIIGANGAGKSTLLRLLAGIYPPTAGGRVVDGRISSVFDISLGFESDASGWENIKFRSYLQGQTARDVRDKIHAIADFTELGKFLDMPVRYYSSGMRLRLAFSIATAIEPEVLLLDEVMSAGDMAFRDKARRRMEEMMSRARILVMVSHDMESLQRLCNRGIWLHKGSVRREGGMDEVVHRYTQWTVRQRKKQQQAADSAQAAQTPMNGIEDEACASWSISLPA
jgi:ABC-type polysaccharide/polyol phosphate transport system ATPase subunit